MALPFLPCGEIEPMFLQLQAQATTATLKRFMQYISTTWIYSSTWPPSSWSVYLKAIRTNNDVERWHNSLNRRASGRSQMAFYMLINLLHREARLTALHARLVSEKKLKRIQRRKYRKLQARVFTYWQEYRNKEKSEAKLLKACANLNGPVSQ